MHLLLLVFACSPEYVPPPSVVTHGVDPETVYDFEVALTVGNHTYVPINMEVAAEDNVEVILHTVAAFERQHTELEVTGFDIQAQQHAHTTQPYTHGVWIHHKPRVEEETAECICSTAPTVSPTPPADAVTPTVDTPDIQPH